MEDNELQILRSKDAEAIKKVLLDFTQNNAELYDFTKLRVNDKWLAIWQAVFAILQDENSKELHTLGLNVIRILTRDEESLQFHDNSNDVFCLLKLALLHKKGNRIRRDQLSYVPSKETIIEALKCLCNLVYQNEFVRTQLVSSCALEAIFMAIAMASTPTTSMELYLMKLLFLLTALEPEVLNSVRLNMNGIAYMTEWVSSRLQEAMQHPENTDNMQVLCELLKVLFNVTSADANETREEAHEIQNLHLTIVTRDILLGIDFNKGEMQRKVVANAINLLSNLCIASLSGMVSREAPPHDDFKFNGYYVRSLDVLLRYLQLVLEEQENSASSQSNIAPVLAVLLKCARSKPIMRRYLRQRVLPPLRDVSQRPEVGNEIRNHLCRFLTLPAMMLRNLAAEFLFVLCKENVGRMIKYTGYGNAAGLFAQRGLLDGRRPPEREEYSSDSDNSDTDEYKQLQSSINPVVGCYEPPQTNPLDNMSEEQKEVEAMKLVNLLDQLNKTGLVQPCRIGADGKPQPVEHILELQEGLQTQQFEPKTES